MSTSTVVIASRFSGPPSSGNGGYVAGLLGAYAHGPARVRLHTPPPLDRALRVEDEGDLRMKDGEVLVATCTPTVLELSPPAPPSLDRARAASLHYPGFTHHPFPTCFVCGPRRAEGDGLRIFPGPIEGQVVAAPFLPPSDLLDTGGRLPTPIIWAALDCTGYFALVGAHPVPMLLGELTVEVRAPIDRGPHVVYGWSLGLEGRKGRCGTALASPEGQILAVGLATWIRPAG